MVFRCDSVITNVYWSMCHEVILIMSFSGSSLSLQGRMADSVARDHLACNRTLGPASLSSLWLFGCAVYWLHRKHKISVMGARLLFLITVALMIFDLATDLNLRIDDQLDLRTRGWVSHGFLRRVVGDTLTGLTIALNVFAARYAAFCILEYFGSLFTYLALFSFALYLMHVPLLRFWLAYWHLGLIGTTVMVLASVWLLGQGPLREAKGSSAQCLASIFSHRPSLGQFVWPYEAPQRGQYRVSVRHVMRFLRMKR